MGYQCPVCDRPAIEVAYSDARGAECCLDCHCEVAPPASLAAMRWKPPAPPPPPKPSRYAKFVTHVRERLEFLTEAYVFSYGDGRHVAAMCPVCLDGAILVTFAEIGGRPAAAYSHDGVDGCTTGCPHDLITQVIG